METIRKVIRTDGTEETLPGPMSIKKIERLIGATVLDTVLLSDRRHVMLVDDLGMARDLPVNEKATVLYLQRCIPGTTHKIRGDVVIVPDDDFGAI